MSSSSSRRARTRLSRTEGCFRFKAMMGKCVVRLFERGESWRLESLGVIFLPAIPIDKRERSQLSRQAMLP